jgi:DNA topoisomerase-1
MTQLIICEKPDAAKKIAEALSDKKPNKHLENKVTYYEITHKGKKIFVGCAVGHLFNLAEKEKNGWIYPVFDIEWRPTYEIRKNADFTKKYYIILKKLSKKSDDFIVACDYDQEGSVIGYNIIRFIANKNDAKRMKFSTLTKDELIDSYEHASKHLDFPLIEAGETRHYLDHYYGISISRALTISIKNSTGRFKIMSSGRVQGPTLAILAKREKEIKNFIPKPFWQIELLAKNGISAWHKQDKFWDKKDADNIIKKTKGKKAFISKITKKQTKQPPPNPFDLTALQIEAYKLFKITPKDTLTIAQNLYTSSYISYPRTSSNQFPISINVKKVMEKLSKQSRYTKFSDELIKNNQLKPNNGKKTDPAHPAIYPTGEIPKKLNPRANKIYDLIVKRFFATFGEAAIRETMNIEIDVNKEIFIAKGTKTIKQGWHKFYQPYVRLEEQELPHLKKKDEIKVKEIKLHLKETQPPKRYTPASIIKELERRGLGTKATRSQILESLYERNYIKDPAIKVTGLGLKTVETLKKYSPDILDEKLTRQFEKEMEEIREGKKNKEKILEKARKILTKILKEFKKHEQKIGKALSDANFETLQQESLIGPCPVCKKGNLTIKRSKFGRFIACSEYPECKATFNIPNNGLIKSANKECLKCNHPMISIIKKGKRPQEICINPKCPSKKLSKEIKDKIKEKPCPKCNGKLVLRGSVYGYFLACNNYPKCKHIEPISTENQNHKSQNKKTSHKV